MDLQGKKNRYPYNFFSVLIICLLLIATFRVAVNSGMRQTIAEPARWYITSMCGAISSLKYGREGYVCYKNVFDKLKAISEIYWYPGKYPQTANQMIQQALTLDDPAQGGVYTMGETDAGYIDYCRLAFMLFGYNIEGLFYMYLLLFLIPVLIFFATFRKNKMAIFTLITFLLAHYLIVKAAPGIGPNLSSVHCYRFMSILAILPLMYILMLTLLERSFRISIFIGALIQAIIFAFILWIRSSILWMVAFLLVYIGIDLLKGRFHQAALAKSVKTKLWPVLLVLFIVLISKISTPFRLDLEYKKGKGTGHHVVWHSIYVGLALNTQVGESYGDSVYGINRAQKREALHSQICSDKNIHGNPLNMAVKKWVCKQYDTNPRIFELIYYQPNDQDGYSAAFNWLQGHNISEYYLFNFRPEEEVAYKKSFSWFSNESEKNKKRELVWEKDFKWFQYESVLRDVIKDVVLKHPLQVIQNVFIDKPIRYLYGYFKYYISVSYLPLLFFSIVLFHFLIGGQSSRSEILQCLKLLAGVFIFSLIPALLVYPSIIVIADSALVFTMCIFCVSFIFINAKPFRLADIFKKKLT